MTSFSVSWGSDESFPIAETAQPEPNFRQLFSMKFAEQIYMPSITGLWTSWNQCVSQYTLAGHSFLLSEIFLCLANTLLCENGSASLVCPGGAWSDCLSGFKQRLLGLHLRGISANNIWSVLRLSRNAKMDVWTNLFKAINLVLQSNIVGTARQTDWNKICHQTSKWTSTKQY